MQQAAAAVLLLAAALGAVAGNHEAGQSNERCYNGPIPAGQASFAYTRGRRTQLHNLYVCGESGIG